jgi:Tfp pilus assembly protein PilF
MVMLCEWYLEVEDNIQAKKIFTDVLSMDPENLQAKKYLEEHSEN